MQYGLPQAANRTGPYRSAPTVVQKLSGRSPESGERPRARAPGRSARTTSVLRVSGADRVYYGLTAAEEGADGVGLSVDRKVEARRSCRYRCEEGVGPIDHTANRIAVRADVVPSQNVVRHGAAKRSWRGCRSGETGHFWDLVNHDPC